MNAEKQYSGGQIRGYRPGGVDTGTDQTGQILGYRSDRAYSGIDQAGDAGIDVLPGHEDTKPRGGFAGRYDLFGTGEYGAKNKRGR